MLYATHAIDLNMSFVAFCFHQALSSAGASILRPLCKSVVGFAVAPPLAAMQPAAVPAAIAAVFAAAPPLPGVGVVPPAAVRFPRPTAVDLTMAEIGYLARWYNNNFGIVGGDNVGAQMKKLRDFLAGYA